jgi:4'-phosphopantetheinyl transferase
VVAVADGRPVGVDVEVTRPDPCDVEVARHFFSAVEITALLASPRSDFATSFLRIWTRKEAWVKAKGQGLSIPLDSFDVSLGPGDARLIAVRGPAGECARWTMADVSGRYFGVDIVACVTATGADWQVSSETWHSGQPKAMCSYTSGGKAAWNETTHRTAPCA